MATAITFSRQNDAGSLASNTRLLCQVAGGYVVVQFYPWFKFYFLLFFGMVIYDNEFETKENKI